MNKLLSILVILFVSTSFAEVLRPKSIEDLKQTSVRILNLEMNSGGTGSILASYKEASHILTNKHVCRLIEPGGKVDYNGRILDITHYKKFQDHDLCLVRVATDLGITLQVADSLAKVSNKAIVSGHPSLLPHIMTIGHLSERMDIELLVGLKKCNKQDMKDDPQSCLWFGGKPIIKTLDAQLVSNLIKPGNSGSAVFNSKGEVIGVVFAGSGRDFSYGFIVPQIYLLYFTQNAHRFDWVKVGTPVKEDEEILDRVFDYEKCQEVRYNQDKKLSKIKTICKNIRDNLIWSK